MKTVAILGKGDLALDIVALCWDLLYPEDMVLVPVRPKVPSFLDLGDWVKRDERLALDPQDLLPTDLVISIGYDKILKPEFLERHGLCLNLHNSPLPRYRGMRPINWALKNGERTHGVTLHQITAGIDDGPIYGQIKFPIWPEIDEVRDVYERCSHYGLELCRDVLPKIDQIAPVEQDETLATYYSGDQADLLGDRKDWTRESSVL
jgi:methionyl-tRNA formyltransferase